MVIKRSRKLDDRQCLYYQNNTGLSRIT